MFLNKKNENIKLKLKNLSYFTIHLSILALYSFPLASCNKGKCDKPSGNRVSMTIPIALQNSSSVNNSGSCEAFASNLLRDAKSKNNVADAFGTSLTSTNDKSKWIIEFYVVGDCGPETVWNELYKKGQWEPVIETVNGVEYLSCKLKDLPTNSPLSIDMTIYSPCYTCSGGSYRSRFPKSTRFSGITAGVTPPEVISFNELTPCQ